MLGTLPLFMNCLSCGLLQSLKKTSLLIGEPLSAHSHAHVLGKILSEKERGESIFTTSCTVYISRIGGGRGNRKEAAREGGVGGIRGVYRTEWGEGEGGQEEAEKLQLIFSVTNSILPGIGLRVKIHKTL